MKVLLEGDIEYMPLTDLLQWIEMNRKTCVLAIVHGSIGTNLYFEDGKIIYASYRSKGVRLGELLVRKNVINESVLLMALSESRKLGKLFTQYLLETGGLSIEVLREIFAELVERILMEAFQYHSGSFTISIPLPDAVMRGPIRLETGRLIFDSVRRLDEKDRDRRDRMRSLEKINERLEKEDFQLPVLPDMIMQLMSVIEDETSTFNDMVRIIMTDQVLISRILKVANSPFYGPGGQIDSIYMAIARMGMREILNIATAFKLNNMEIPNIPRVKLQAILDDALKTAFLASELARCCRIDPEEAFLGGLLHDLGKTVILSLADSNHKEDPFLEEFIAARHAEIGALIAAKWNYPESIRNLILNHHNCKFSGALDKMIGVVQLSDGIIRAGMETGYDENIAASLKLQHSLVQEIFHKAIDTFNYVKTL